MPEPNSHPISHEALAMLAAARRDAEAAGGPEVSRITHATPLPVIDSIERAASVANTGGTAAAGAIFRESITDSSDLRLLFIAFQFFFRTGDLGQAEYFTRRRVTIAESLGELALPDLARALSNLALVLCTRSQLDEAEASARRAIAIDRQCGDDRALSRDLGNLAMVFESRAAPTDLNVAESLYHEALDIARRIGADDLAATKLANLGDIALVRARPAQAVDLWSQAAQLFESLGSERYRQQMMAKIASHSPPQT